MEPLLSAELEKVIREGVTDDEVLRVRNSLQVAYWTRLESNTGIRESLAQAESAGTWRDFVDSPRRIAAVTKEDVQRVAKQYVVRDGRNVLVTNRKGGPPGGGARRRPGASAPAPEEVK